MLPLPEISDLLGCDVHSPAEHLPAVSILYGCASDLMSDVLAFSRSGSVLLTGLVTPQTVHTAFIADVGAVIFVRGKRPGTDVTALARDKGIPLLSTPYSMYEACGILYRHGLASTMHPGERIPGAVRQP